MVQMCLQDLTESVPASLRLGELCKCRRAQGLTFMLMPSRVAK